MTVDQATAHLPETTRPQSGGCGHLILYTSALLWTLTCCLIAGIVAWSLEQVIFDGSLKVPDLRWAVTFTLGIFIIIPFGIIALLLKTKKSKAIYSTLAWGGFLTLTMFPARFSVIYDAQSIALMQVAGAFLYLIIFLGWDILSGRRRAFSIGGHALKGVGAALLFVGVLFYPWVLNGALGSMMDVILNIALTLLIGAGSAITLSATLFSETQGDLNTYSHQAFLQDGLTTAFFLCIVVLGVAQSGNQWVVAFIPLTGWLCVAISLYGGQERGGFNVIALALLIGGAFLAPLLWLDADELMAVISMSEGELMSWAGNMLVISLIWTIVASVLTSVFWRRLAQAQRLSRYVGALALVVWIGAIGVYFLVGQPGFYGEKLFVVMKDQLDVSQYTAVSDYPLRREKTYHALVEHAQKTQVDIKESLDRFRIPHRSYYLVNAVEVDGGLFIKLWLSTRSDVDRVLDNPILRPLAAPIPEGRGDEKFPPEKPQWNLTMIGADRVWRELGVTGKGVVVGQSDSGVQGDHPELADSYRGRDGKNDYNWYDPWFKTTTPHDIGGHGTHTLGSVLGNHVGVAPDAEWIGCVNLARNLGNPSLYLDCMQFMLAPFPQNGDPFKDGDAARGAQVLNNSWGCPEVEGCDARVMEPAVKALKSAGVFVVVSAGNSGDTGCGSVEDPLAIYEQVYTVGAVDQDEKLTEFSSIGPVTVDGSQRTKPDIVAPGQGVLSSFPGSTYIKESGTSMAGPHLAGVVALMWSANPKLVGDIEKTREILNATARPYQSQYPACVESMTVPNNAVGYGIVDAYAAVKMAQSLAK